MMTRFGSVALFAASLAAGGPALAAVDCGEGGGHQRSAFSGALVQPEQFVHPFGEGYRLELVPAESGWDIAIFGADGNALTVILPASGIPRSHPLALLGREFALYAGQSGVAGPSVTRRFAFGEEARNPLLYPELTIVPAAPGGAGGGPAPAPSFGEGVIEVGRFLLDESAGEPRLIELDFEGCIAWLPVAAEDAVADAAGENMLAEAARDFAAIADVLMQAHRGEIDSATTALARVEALRENLRAIRGQWRAAAMAEREAERGAHMLALEAAERALIAAIAEFGAGPNVYYPVLHALAEPPIAGDFLREPPIETFQGIYRRGFEASDFYLFDGEGPWWLESTSAVWEELQTHMVERPGRGSSVTVVLTVTGWRESEGGYGAFGNYESRIYVESIEAVRAITEDEFWQAVRRP